MSTDTKESKDMYLAMKDGTDLFYHQEFPQKMKAVVVFVHGVNEHCGRYEYLAGRMNSAGYGVIRFDLRGHGRSGGERAYASSFLQFTQDVEEFVLMAKKDAPDIPVFMLGHSMGAFISATYGIQYPDEIKGQVLSGLPATVLPLPTIKLLKIMPYNRFPMLRANAGVADTISRDPAVVQKYKDDPLIMKQSTIKMASEMFLKGPAWLAEHIGEYRLPCLLLHGGADVIVTPAASEWFFNAIPSADKQRKVYPDLYHEIFNEKERDEVIADAISWLDARVS